MEMEISNQTDKESFWKLPLPHESVYFVDSSESEEFQLFLLALEESAILAMDAEWKPVYGTHVSGGHIRVSILQIACRLQQHSEIWKEVMKGESSRFSKLEPEDKMCKTQCSVLEDYADDKHVDQLSNGAPKFANVNAAPQEAEAEQACCIRGDRQLRMEVQLGKGLRDSDEIVFILDMLALSATSFSTPLKAAFCSSRVLKLGFDFKQDLGNLAATFPGPDALGCFNKGGVPLMCEVKEDIAQQGLVITNKKTLEESLVEPYLDVGNLYQQMKKNRASHKYGGRKGSFGSNGGLASLCETLFGLPLNKDVQCSNWEQRPLTKEQFEYAATDAYCLLAIYDALQIEFARIEGWCETNSVTKSGVGVAELLNHLSPKLQDFRSSTQAFSSICHSTRTPATAMVEAARMSCITNLTQGFSGLSTHGQRALSFEMLVQKFGERLLVNLGGDVKTHARRKTRRRGAREAGSKGRDLQMEEQITWVGPPPWDAAVGGDDIPKFLCDIMVEGLARQLRCVGIDAASPGSKNEPRELVDTAEREGRILLTRDIKLLRRRLVPKNMAYRVKRQGKWEQLAEIIETFKLSINESQLLSRCTKCNGEFLPEPMNAKQAAAQALWTQTVPSCVLSNVNEFWQCSKCRHLYWQGFQFIRAYRQFSEKIIKPVSCS